MKDALEREAAIFAKMESPLYAAMTIAAAADYDRGGAVRALFESVPSRQMRSTPAVRLMGAFHACALDGSAPTIAAHFPSCGGDGDAKAAWDAAVAFLRDNPARIAELFDETPQTNEPARSMPLLAGALAIAAHTGLPLRVFEPAASAGLNTRFDGYRYEGEGWSWGDPASPLVLRNRTLSGTPQHLYAPLRICERAACDLHPLDVANPEHRTRLRSFVWADQLERFERLNSAIAGAQAIPLTIDRANMSDWVGAAATPREGAATVVMHSIVFEHLSEFDRAHFVDTIHALAALATERAPFARLAMEFDGQRIETRATIWPGRREFPIAISTGHGQDLQWAPAA